MLLVDSSYYIELLRSERDPVSALAPWLESGRLLCCGIVRCEVLRGIRSPRIHARMKELFEVAADAAFTSEVWGKVAELAWKLDRTGAVLPLTDIAIAVCALRHGAQVVTVDPHFRSIPGLGVRDTLPAAP